MEISLFLRRKDNVNFLKMLETNKIIINFIGMNNEK